MRSPKFSDFKESFKKKKLLVILASEGFAYANKLINIRCCSDWSISVCPKNLQSIIMSPLASCLKPELKSSTHSWRCGWRLLEMLMFY